MNTVWPLVHSWTGRGSWRSWGGWDHSWKHGVTVAVWKRSWINQSCSIKLFKKSIKLKTLSTWFFCSQYIKIQQSSVVCEKQVGRFFLGSKHANPKTNEVYIIFNLRLFSNLWYKLKQVVFKIFFFNFHPNHLNLLSMKKIIVLDLFRKYCLKSKSIFSILAFNAWNTFTQAMASFVLTAPIKTICHKKLARLASWPRVKIKYLTGFKHVRFRNDEDVASEIASLTISIYF